MLTIDLETRSDKDITKCGVYPYAESDSFEILLFSYAADDGEVKTIDIANGEQIPREILDTLTDESIIKRAHNVNFERVCLSRYLKKKYPDIISGDYLSPRGWRCTMIHCRYLGLPSSLAEAGQALGIPEQKMDVGKPLIKFFCTPYDWENDRPLFHNPVLYPDKWEMFKTYNKRDVEAETAIEKRLSPFPVPESVWEEFYLDQQINDRGILIDKDFVESALKLDSETRRCLLGQARELTGIENPNSAFQLLEWLERQGYDAASLNKESVKNLLRTAKEPVRTVLRLRQQLSRSSVRKYTAMANAMCRDSRARGMFSFYGASRTGRYAGRLIQLQNLPQNRLPDLEKARELVKHGAYDDVKTFYDDVPDTLSQLIRTAFIPKKGCKFIVADFSAIEARVIAWLAGEQWRLDAFRNGEDIYCASASKMFGVPVQKHGVNGHLRQKGKVAELACGYGGSVGAMRRMGGEDLKLAENIVQGTARDILLHAMRNLAEYGIVAHVHDEVILECARDTSVDAICELMARTPEWCPDLPLKADGYECGFYQKQ